jgi:hypothetical protein
MGFRFQRRLQVVPGVRLNIGTRATSLSFGHRGAWLTVGPHGRRRATLGWPGTGISYSKDLSRGQRPNPGSKRAGVARVAGSTRGAGCDRERVSARPRAFRL